MKITYIHQHFRLPHEAGGSRPYEFARRLAADGHEVTMICGGAAPIMERIDGINVHRLSVAYDNSMSYSKRIAAFVKFIAKATMVAVRQPADVVFASSTPLTTAIPGMVAAVVRRAPFIFEVRDLWPQVPIDLGILTNPVIIAAARLLERLTYRRARHIIALSPSMRDGVLDVRPAAEVTVVPNAADFARFDRTAEQRQVDKQEFGWDDGRVTVVYAGGFGMSYQLDWVVDLAAQLVDAPIRIVAYGHGSDFADLQRRAQDHGLDADALLPGSIGKDEVARRVAAADIVLSPLRDDPSLEGNSLNKVFDAMAAGRPVVFNHGGWLSEHMVAEGAGWRLPRDTARAAEELRELTQQSEVIAAAGAAAAAIGHECYSRDVLYARFSEVLTTHN